MIQQKGGYGQLEAMTCQMAADIPWEMPVKILDSATLEITDNLLESTSAAGSKSLYVAKGKRSPFRSISAGVGVGWGEGKRISRSSWKKFGLGK